MPAVEEAGDGGVTGHPRTVGRPHLKIDQGERLVRDSLRQRQRSGRFREPLQIVSLFRSEGIFKPAVERTRNFHFF
ncbi:hypothetical protein CCHR01_06464 [Colletotrichum chrysophilum]|uniref:Uncharacterized protein n=1 Tax=Colletotrichum chrysophilum TaxID=1836956 RepID=A0AAD9APP6_9PEZI|nr:hypothetical protein CCHR01_06464 [Colletotrichum chrysophilum]